MGRIVGWVALLPLLLLPGSRADACSEALPWLDRRLVLPADGATGVPTNTRVVVEYDAWGSWQLDGAIELRVAGGATVAVTDAKSERIGLRAVRVTPAVVLEPNTTYEIYDSMAVPCEDPNNEGLDCRGAPTLIATFTTGADPDTQAPQSQWSVTSSFGADGPATSCDWWGNYVTHATTVESVTDDRPIDEIRYLYEAPGEPTRGPVPASVLGHVCHQEPYIPGYDLYFPSDSFSVRGIDLAGNVEVVAHQFAQPSCEELEAAQSGDGGLGDDTASEDDAGCCSTGGDPVAALGLLALGLRRRRRDSSDRGAPRASTWWSWPLSARPSRPGTRRRHRSDARPALPDS